jgi:hypothetical protein
MKLAYLAAATISAVMLSAPPSLAQTKTGVDRLYVLDCGQGFLPDQARLSPGVNVGIAEILRLTGGPANRCVWNAGAACAGVPDAARLCRGIVANAGITRGTR